MRVKMSKQPPPAPTTSAVGPCPDGKVSIGYRNITNLRFADDIDALAEEEQELEALVESLNKTCKRYKVEISAEKTNLMTNSANGIQREIKVKGQKLGTVTSIKYLGAVVSDDGTKPEVLSRIAQATAALTKLKPIWRDNNISLGSKVKLMCSLVISIFLYDCESWTLIAELEKRTQAFEMRCYRRLLNISYKDHVTNEEVQLISINPSISSIVCLLSTRVDLDDSNVMTSLL